MKIQTVFITYNRLELSKRAFATYQDTVNVPHFVWVVDNASTDGTQEWIHELFVANEIDGMVLFKNNMYPGAAANEGWNRLDDDVTHLHRADNDFVFLPGWCDEVMKRFRNPKLGQLGLRTNEEELWNLNDVGGNCVIRRELWDMGLRYDERPWPQIAVEVGEGWSEDGLFSPAVNQYGYSWTRVKKPCIEPISSGDLTDPYYVKSLADRGVVAE